MARTRIIGSTNRDSNYEVTVRKPLDARSLVKTYDDLTNKENWVNISGNSIVYNGMLVAVWLNNDDTSKNGIYFLHDPNVTSTKGENSIPNVENKANWHKLADMSALASINAKLPVIDELALRAQGLEDILNGTNKTEGLIAEVTKNTAAIAAITSMSTEVVDNLPEIAKAKSGVIYLVADSSATGNYVEYILVDNNGTKAFEQIGSTAIDLTNYVTKDDLVAELFPYAKSSDVVINADFSDFKLSTNSKILEISTAINTKANVADLANYYTLSAADNKFATLASVESSLANKIDKSLVYTKPEINDIQAALIAQVDSKADLATTYTKEEINALLDNIEGGSSDSAASVARDLAAYESKTDAAILSIETRVGTDKVGDIAATGLFAKVSAVQDLVVTEIANKADISSVYTKEQIDQKFDRVVPQIEGIAASLNTLQGSDTDKSIRQIAVDEINNLIKTADNNIDTIASLVDQVSENTENIIKIFADNEKTSAKLDSVVVTLEAIEESIQNTPQLEVATETALGGIKSGSGANTVSVDEDGIASVKSINVKTLSQDDGDVLILNGGSCNQNIKL